MTSEARAQSICIVTPGYISSTPRVVKEADTLSAAGYAVKAVSTQGDIERLRVADRDLIRHKPWRWTAVDLGRGLLKEDLRSRRAALRYHVAKRLPGMLWRMRGVAERAEGRLYPELARLARRERADLYIGHYPTGLGAAAAAATRWGALLAYDAEDLHTGERAGPEDPLRPLRVDTIERRYLRRCAYVTAASPGIARELEKRYGLAQVRVVHNVFPMADRDNLDGRTLDRQGPELSLYWFSQTVGLDRGLQDAIRACGLVDGPVQLHIRGSLSDEVRNELCSIAAENGVDERTLHFHPQVPPGELLSRTAEHDVGLALEHPVSPSRALSVTNKLFLYFIAGLATAVTDVPGQRKVIETCPGAGCLYQPGDFRSLAQHLERWRRSLDDLRSYKGAALAAAGARWNWELEQETLRVAVRSVLDPRVRDDTA